MVLKDGNEKKYYPEGQVMIDREYVEGRCVSVTVYEKNGSVKRHWHSSNNHLIPSGREMTKEESIEEPQWVIESLVCPEFRTEKSLSCHQITEI
jgi:hypothetical protein